MCWGELDEHGKPVSKHKGTSYLRWVRNVCRYGYDFDWRILNAADFGAYTSRKRFFGQFALHGLPIVFPLQTHAKETVSFGKEKTTEGVYRPNPDWSELFPGYYKPWKAVRDVLDLQDDGTSIFGKKKPLCERTLERIYAGLVKFVAGGKKQHEAWILKYNSMNKNHYHVAPSIDEPCPTVTVQNRLGLVKCNFLSKQFGGSPEGKNIPVDGPAGAITTRDHHAFITAYYGNGFNHSIEEPAPTITTSDRFGIVKSVFMANEYSGGGQISDLEAPCPAVLTTPKQKIVSAQYLMNPQYQSEGGSIDSPCFTLIARMDKMPPYLISTEKGLGIAIYEDDSPMTKKVKEFMAMYGIVDIKMRMLKISELKKIMGFPEDYVLIGTQAEQKKFIGNAVEVNMSRVLCEALCTRLSKENRVAV